MAASARRIGIYGGTFDPIHHGHLILAREAADLFQLDQVIFVPARMSPHKLGVRVAPDADRLEMLQAAIAHEPRFAVDALELKRPPPSFAIDTLEAFAQRDADAQFFLLIGEDQLKRFGTWHRAEDLRKMAEPIVLRRGDVSGSKTKLSVPRRIDISATEIRNRVASGASIRYLVPDAVAAIIAARQLYRN